MCTKEKFYDDCGVELLPGDVVKAKNVFGEFIRIFIHKKGDLYSLVDNGRSNCISRSGQWDNAVFYARPPAKQKYVRSRKEVAQILLDDGWEPLPSGAWLATNGDMFYPERFNDCCLKVSSCLFAWSDWGYEKFLEDR